MSRGNLHRVFIAINLPEETKGELLAYKDKWPEVPARWTTPENLHSTLAFLGNTSDEELAEICELLQPIGERHKSFLVTIEKIVYGPKPTSPRMIWAKVKKSVELLALQKDIEKTLGLPAAEAGQGSDKNFSPHLTLARVKTFELQRMEPEELPDIDVDISLSFPVSSIEIMQSELKRSGPVYTICQSIPLAGN